MSKIVPSVPKVNESPPKVAEKPKVEEKPQLQLQPPAPKTKTVSFTKTQGGKWHAKFSPEVTRLDVNHLTRLIRVEFSRAKRDRRIENRKIARKELMTAEPSQKETTNAR